MRVIMFMLLIVLAGCGSATTPEPTTEATVTPAPIPVSDESLATEALAPGLATDGVFAANRLAEAHAAALANHSFTVVQRNTRYTNGTLQQGDRSILQYGADGRQFVYDLRQTDRRGMQNSTSRYQRYANGEQVYIAETQTGETSYRLLRAADGSLSDPSQVFPDNATNTRGLVRVFVLVNTEVTSTRTTNGTTIYRVETPGPQTLPPLQNISFVAFVAETGFIRSYQLEYDVVRSAELVHIVANTTYQAVGKTTVSEPRWVDAARAELQNETMTPATTAVRFPTQAGTHGFGTVPSQTKSAD
jgi:hypothetical protein